MSDIGSNRAADSKRGEEFSLVKAAQVLLEECRTILPGIQTLFGFQLIVVFSARFEWLLSAREQHLHLIACGLVAVAIALIMTPAAYHRHTGPQLITEKLVKIYTRSILLSMPPLAVAIAMEIYLISRVIAGYGVARVISLTLLGVIAFLWFGLPRIGPRDGK
jgi:hypothetical protein